MRDTGIRSLRAGRGVTALVLLLGLWACGPAEDPQPPRAPDRAMQPGGDGPIVRVLGSVQDGGLPHAGCDCVRCAEARRDPAAVRYVASLGVIVPQAGLRFLVDATPDVRPQLHELGRGQAEAAGPRVERELLDGVLLTHAHMGHYLGLAFFGYESAHTRRLPVHCSAEMASYLRSNGPWDQLVRLENIVLHEIESGTAVRLHSTLEFTAFTVPHRREYTDTLGLILRGPRRSLLYVPDTDGWDDWDPPLLEVLEEVDIALLDGTFFSPDELPGRELRSIGHPLIERSMDLLEPLVESGRVEVWFTHLNHSNPALDPRGEELRAIRERGFGVVREGQEFEL